MIGNERVVNFDDVRVLLEAMQGEGFLEDARLYGSISLGLNWMVVGMGVEATDL